MGEGIFFGTLGDLVLFDGVRDPGLFRACLAKSELPADRMRSFFSISVDFGIGNPLLKRFILPHSSTEEEEEGKS